MQHLPINIGAYKDDWLAVSSQTNRQVEKTKQQIAKIFKDHGLSLEIQCNHTAMDFLDISLDLKSGLFKPFMKENNVIHYVHNKSNHPPSILKNLPKGVEQRLSKISANEEIFITSTAPYQAALEASGYSHKLKFDPNARNKPPKNRRRNRKVTWFNPPFNKNVKTNVGKQFLAILRETFPPTDPLHKICNKNTIKVSYRCMNNMKREVSRHNNKILNRAAIAQTYHCSCPGKNPDTCLIFPGIGCTISNIVYRATVTRADTSHKETYTGSTCQTMKGRLNTGHNQDMKNRSRDGTTLSAHIWNLKDQRIAYTLKWDIIKKAAPWNPITKVCRLCIAEKHHILFHPEDSSLNQRSEFFSKCWHKKRHLLV